MATFITNKITPEIRQDSSLNLYESGRHLNKGKTIIGVIENRLVDGVMKTVVNVNNGLWVLRNDVDVSSGFSRIDGDEQQGKTIVAKKNKVQTFATVAGLSLVFGILGENLVKSKKWTIVLSIVGGVAGYLIDSNIQSKK